MANDQAPERIWLQRIRDGEMDGWTWCAEQIGADDVAYVRADASPLPPPGSAGEAEMVERILVRAEEAYRLAVDHDTSGWITGEWQCAYQKAALTIALRAAFGGSGAAAGEESGDA